MRAGGRRVLRPCAEKSVVLDGAFAICAAAAVDCACAASAGSNMTANASERAAIPIRMVSLSSRQFRATVPDCGVPVNLLQGPRHSGHASSRGPGIQRDFIEIPGSREGARSGMTGWPGALPNRARCSRTGAMWTSLKAPSLAEMEAMAHDEFGRLPKGFRALCEGVILRVDDFPTDEVLDEMNAASEFDLLGLFQGVGLPQQSHQDIGRLPNMVWLYRPPVLDHWAAHDDT